MHRRLANNQPLYYNCPMKQLLLIWAVLFTGANLFADKVILETLPPPNYLDTEVSTNIALQSYSTSHKIAIDLAFNITSSNQYDISFGNDSTPINGSLSSYETLLSLGWDDSWYLSLPQNTIKYTSPHIIDQNQIIANIRILQDFTGKINEFSFKENNTSIFSQETLKTRFTHSFSHIKITKRGINASLQDIVIKTSPLATKVIIQ